MNKSFTLLFLVAIAMTFFSCQKTIDAPLGTTEQKSGLAVGNKFQCLLNLEVWKPEFNESNTNPYYIIYNETSGKLFIRANRISNDQEEGETNQTFAIQQIVKATGQFVADPEATYYRDNLNCGSYFLDSNNNTSELEVTELDLLGLFYL